MGSPERDHDLRAALRDAAQEYEPDRTRISNRVAAGRSAATSRGWVLRPLAAAAAVAVISVLSVVAVRAGDDPVQPPPLAVPVTASAEPSASKAGTATSQHSPRPSSHPTTPPTSPSSGGPTGSRTTAAFMSCSGGVGANSVATWSEQTVKITVTEPVDSLTVTIKVALSDDAAYANKWTSVPNSDLTVTVTPGTSAIAYTFALRKGVKLIPGDYTFAAQFNHHSGRGMSKDSYTIKARSGDDHADLAGGFV